MQHRKTAVCLISIMMITTCFVTSCKTLTPDGTGTSTAVQPVPSGVPSDPWGKPDGGMDEVGDWQPAEETTITDEMKMIYDAATADNPDKKYSVLAYIASRSNKGLDHCFLCRKQQDYKLVCINESYQDEIKLIGDADLEWPGKTVDGTIGSWGLSGDVVVPDSAVIIADKASASADEIYTPVAELGVQTVRGYNHSMLCIAEPRNPDSPAVEGKLKLVSIFESFDGSVKLNDAADFDLNSYFPAT